jgi:hypothetical protein
MQKEAQTSTWYDCYDLVTHQYYRVYFICENQRHWLGIGWVPELFHDERGKFSTLDGSMSFDTLDQVVPAHFTGRGEWRSVNSKQLYQEIFNDAQGAEALSFLADLCTSEPGPQDSWEYADTYWKLFSMTPYTLAVTRRRLRVCSVPMDFAQDGSCMTLE